ncbi:MAG: 30S ribosomal protein S16 [Candidatus Marinimicrobia bacterium]|nr:30S ribosomal protein S16 [Candidatus Neomarinimicrobiota bacterium]
MATKIRLKRIGRRNRPFYRMVAMDSRNRRDGAAIEELGWYNPIDADHSYDLKGERILHWLKEGAEPSEAAHKLLRRAGIAHRWHLIKQGLDEAQIDKEMKKWELNRDDVIKARSERKEKKAEEKVKAAAVEAEAQAEETEEVTDSEESSDDVEEEEPAEESQEEESPDEAEVNEEPVDDAAGEETPTDESSEEGEESPAEEPEKEESIEENIESSAAIEDSDDTPADEEDASEEE